MIIWSRLLFIKVTTLIVIGMSIAFAAAPESIAAKIHPAQGKISSRLTALSSQTASSPGISITAKLGLAGR